MMQNKTTRNQEITKIYLNFIENHVEDVASGNVSEFMELNQIASELAISHQHLTDTVKKETGNHPCHFYDGKIIEKAKNLILTTEKPISEIAHILTYDPSNFSKFFKKWTGFTPANFRKTHL